MTEGVPVAQPLSFPAKPPAKHSTAHQHDSAEEDEEQVGGRVGQGETGFIKGDGKLPPAKSEARDAAQKGGSGEQPDFFQSTHPSFVAASAARVSKYSS